MGKMNYEKLTRRDSLRREDSVSTAKLAHELALKRYGKPYPAGFVSREKGTRPTPNAGK